MRTLPLALLSLLVLIAGCGGGRVVTQTRAVPHFDRIAIADAVDVEVVPGDSRSVVVTAGENVIDRVHTDSRAGVLRVDIRDRGIVIGPDPFDDVRVRVPAATLDGIRIAGAGDVRLDGIDADELALEVDGSGDVEGSGSVDRLIATIEGSGDARLFDLHARTARVGVVGSGELHLNVSDELDVTVQGSGDVRYRGNPSVRQSVEGSGEVAPDD